MAPERHHRRRWAPRSGRRCWRAAAAACARDLGLEPRSVSPLHRHVHGLSHQQHHGHHGHAVSLVHGAASARVSSETTPSPSRPFARVYARMRVCVYACMREWIEIENEATTKKYDEREKWSNKYVWVAGGALSISVASLPETLMRWVARQRVLPLSFSRSPLPLCFFAFSPLSRSFLRSRFECVFVCLSYSGSNSSSLGRSRTTRTTRTTTSQQNRQLTIQGVLQTNPFGGSLSTATNPSLSSLRSILHLSTTHQSTNQPTNHG